MRSSPTRPGITANTWLSYAFSDDWRGGSAWTYTGAYQGCAVGQVAWATPMPGATVADFALTYVRQPELLGKTWLGKPVWTDLLRG